MSDQEQNAPRSFSGRPVIPAVAELVARAGQVERVLDDLYAVDAETARGLLEQMRAIRRTVRHVDDLVWLLAHDQAGLSYRELGAAIGRYHNAAVKRHERAARRHPGGVEEAARSAVVHDEAQGREDTGD